MGRTGKGERWERKRGKGGEEKKWRETKESCQKPRFLFFIFGGSYTHPIPIWATFGIKVKCRPMVYSSMPNSIVIGLCYYI